MNHKRKRECEGLMRSIHDYDADELTCGMKIAPNILEYNLIDPILQTPMDIMHTILEGVCRRQKMNVFDDWIITKRTTPEEMEKRVQNFNYGYYFKDDKIPKITKSDLNKQQFMVSATEMKTLSLLFPFIFDGIVDLEHDEYK